MPLFNRSFFQVIDVADLATLDSLLQNLPKSHSPLDFDHNSKKTFFLKYSH